MGDRTIFFMPDGNRRYARKKRIPLIKAYEKGFKTLKLLTDFFLVEKRERRLIYTIYTYIRKNGTFLAVCDACKNGFEKLIKNKFFEKRGIKFKVINNSYPLPKELNKVMNKLIGLIKRGGRGEVVILFGYSLKKDIENSLLKNPKTYKKFIKNLLFKDIDIAIRTTKMRISNGPIYAMAQAQMMRLNKLNPELTKKDLKKLWGDYFRIESYRRENWKIKNYGK